MLVAVIVTAVLTPIAHSLSSDLAQVNGYVSPAQHVEMYSYVPAAKATGPQAIVVAIHSCHRTAGYYFDNTGYASLADQFGYIVIYPNMSTPDGCWDVS
jgi:acetylxylan esterase